MATPFDNVLDPFTISAGGPSDFGIPQMGIPIMPPFQASPASPIPQEDIAPSTALSAGSPPPEIGGLPPGFSMALPPVQFGQQPQQAPPQQLAYRGAMQDIESSGRYDLVTPTGRGYNVIGAYQVSERNIPEWTRRWVGRAMTPEEFRRSPEAQDAVFDGQFAEYIRQFGSPQKAAEAWMSPVAAAGGQVGPDRFGTNAAAHGRNFISALSRRGVSQQPGFSPSTMEMSSDMAAATGVAGATSVPAPGSLSPRAAAMAPGLATSQTAPAAAGPFTPMAPPNPQFAPGYNPGVAEGLPFGDLWQNTLRTPSSGLTQLASYMAQAEPAENMAITQIYQRGQELQAENPGMAPQQIAQMLVRDPVFGRNALFVGRVAPAVLQAAVQPIAPPQVMQAGPGTQFFQQQGGQVTPMGVGVPPTPPQELQVLQGILQMPEIRAMPPDQQLNAAISIMGQLRQARGIPSDREQAIARIQMEEQAAAREGREPNISQHDLQLGGYLRIVPQYGPTGNVTGEQVISTYRPGGAVSQTAPSSRYTGSAAPPVAPGVAAGAPGDTPVTPPAGGPGAPPSMITPPRVIARRGGREVRDTPELSLSTSLIGDPAEMALGAGPIAGFLGIWGRVVGNLYPGTEEEVLARQTLMDQFRSSYTQYVQSTKLKSEHEAAMAAIPTSGEILTNPLRAVNQFIGLREGLIREYELALQQARDQNRDPVSRREADKRVAEIQNVLLRMPSQVGLYQLSERLRSGEAIAGTQPSEVGGRVGGAVGVGRRAIEDTVGGRPAQTALPRSLGGLGLAELQRLSRRENLSAADRQRLIQAIRDLNPETDRPRVPRSE